MNQSLQSSYQKAIRFAGEKHGDQKMPDSRSSYLVHLSLVAMELMMAHADKANFDLEFALQVALLHDVLEDTDTSFEALVEEFSRPIAEAVLALTKNEDLPTEEQIPDSLERIRSFPKEVWAVKLADRISNMQQPPPSWSLEKKQNYCRMAEKILNKLKGGNAYLEKRLQEKIKAYPRYY